MNNMNVNVFNKGSDEDERFLEEKNWEAQQIQKAVKQVISTLFAFFNTF